MSQSLENQKQSMANAALSGDIKTLQMLLKAGIHPEKNFPAGKFPPSPLFFACSKGNLEAAIILHEFGADLERVNDKSFPMTYLMLAAQSGHAAIVQWLLHEGVDPQRKCEGKTAYDFAASVGNADIARILQIFSNKTLDLDEQLVMASQRGDVQAVLALLKDGADYQSVEVGGFNAFMWACINGHAAVIKVLLQHGASPYQEGGDTFSALQWASMKGQVEVIDVLWEADSKLEQRFVLRELIPNEPMETRVRRLLQSQEFAQAVALQNQQMDDEDSVIESADWFGTTGLDEDTERDLSRYLRREFGESVHDEDSLRAEDLTYLGKYTEQEVLVHYWLIPARTGTKKYYAYVEVGPVGQLNMGWGNRNPPDI